MVTIIEVGIILLIYELLKYIKFRCTNYRYVNKQGSKIQIITSSSKDLDFEGFERIKWYQWW